MQKWLGANSSKQATTIRSANAGSPENGLARIWQRLEDQFGCPQIIEQSSTDEYNYMCMAGREPIIMSNRLRVGALKYVATVVWVLSHVPR